jgi:predicted ArsR family transcriptional regulator
VPTPVRDDARLPGCPEQTNANAGTGTGTGTDCSTRHRILRLVVEEGPVSVVQLAADLHLTAAGARRHVVALLDAGEIVEHVGPSRHIGRGRPARRYVATSRGQSALSDACSDLATQAIEFLGTLGGPDAVREFADRCVGSLVRGHVAEVEGAGEEIADRVNALAAGLAADGYATSVRPLPGGRAVQLCQGHCPVQSVASRFPELCEAEARLFSRMLGVRVQRLSTLAGGAHVCTTHIPLTTPDRGAAPAATGEGAR